MSSTLDNSTEYLQAQLRRKNQTIHEQTEKIESLEVIVREWEATHQKTLKEAEVKVAKGTFTSVEILYSFFFVESQRTAKEIEGLNARLKLLSEFETVTAALYLPSA